MSKGEIVTAAWLRKQGACESQVITFTKEWGQQVRLTREVILRGAELNLDLEWFAEHYLPAPLWAEYQRQCMPLWAEYERQLAPLDAEYECQVTRLYAEHERQVAAVWAEYERQRATLRTEYKRQRPLLVLAEVIAGTASPQAAEPAQEEEA